MKWVGLVLLLAGLLFSGWTISENWSRPTSESEVFHRLWNEDLVHLSEGKKLPEGWKRIRMVEYIPLDKEAWTWIENQKPDIAIDPEGTFKLQVLVDQWDDDEGKAALVEYHLIDLSTENKIWELARTYSIRDPVK